MSARSVVSSSARSSRWVRITSRRRSQLSRKSGVASSRSACSRMCQILSSMMEILSTSEPTVSATPASLGCPHGLHHRLVDALDQVVAALVEAVHGALGGGHLVVVVDARLVLLVPQLHVGRGELR